MKYNFLILFIVFAPLHLYADNEIDTSFFNKTLPYYNWSKGQDQTNKKVSSCYDKYVFNSTKLHPILVLSSAGRFCENDYITAIASKQFYAHRNKTMAFILADKSIPDDFKPSAADLLNISLCRYADGFVYGAAGVFRRTIEKSKTVEFCKRWEDTAFILHKTS